MATPTKRVAILLAGLSVAAAIVGSIAALRVFYQNGGVPLLALWMLVPLGLTIGGFIASRGQSIAPMWVSIGGLWGFVVLAAFSLGPFYAIAALMLLAAGIVHLVAVIAPRTQLGSTDRSWWSAVLVPLWIVEGLSSLPMALLLVGAVGEMLGGPRIILPGQTRASAPGTTRFIPPLMMFGSWMFVAAAAWLATGYAARSVGRKSRPRRPSVGVAVLLLAGTLIGILAAQQAVGQLRHGNGGGCSSMNGRGTCTAE